MSGIRVRLASFAGAAVAAALLSAGAAFAADDAAEREARWKDLRQTVFGDRAVEETRDVISVDAPVRAEEASLVPIALQSARPDLVKATTFIIDDNSSLVTDRVTFGTAGDPSLMTTLHDARTGFPGATELGNRR